MCNGYHVGDEDVHPDLEDEFLCEYVDGTMDPVVKEVFEEYIRANPDLRDHIECLRHTRLLLCRYGCRCHAPNDLQDQLRRKITCDLLSDGVPFHIPAADRLKAVGTVSCALAVLLMLGLVVGVSVVDVQSGYPQIVSAAVVGAQDLAPQTDIDDQVRRAEPSSMMQSFPYSPRSLRAAPLHPAPSLVASGIEHEMGAGPRTVPAVAAEPVFP